ncbi:hypothetical protein Sinac_3402 [Singulisphaera acidiphila DSM 18658]|uniref:Uncharacterized protein n=1 Tax=Singulisphaera acidiphila (strain ATCC BAA-1392 / DSM 18658 / VKM B-2454 / MOB10) TaxID=886293 RepID=L0DFR7_SINAD|nr:hypothetical protein Sinac_3402 [Singulisphaera acidiphila DSM 18658]
MDPRAHYPARRALSDNQGETQTKRAATAQVATIEGHYLHPRTLLSTWVRTYNIARHGKRSKTIPLRRQITVQGRELAAVGPCAVSMGEAENHPAKTPTATLHNSDTFHGDTNAIKSNRTLAFLRIASRAGPDSQSRENHERFWS